MEGKMWEGRNAEPSGGETLQPSSVQHCQLKNKRSGLKKRNKYLFEKEKRQRDTLITFFSFFIIQISRRKMP
jgi:hypothetical protein